MCANFTCQYFVITGSEQISAMISAENTKRNLPLIVLQERINKIEVSVPKSFKTKIIASSKLVSFIFK